MKLAHNIFILVLIGITLHSKGQDFRYSEKVFTQVDTLKNVEYAQAEWLNNPIGLLADYNIHDGEQNTELRPLLMDIFMPANDTLSKRPAIIFSHSGAFLKGSRLADDMQAFCDSFARRGYVTATVDYRIGMGASVSRILGVIVGLSVDEENAKRAAYRATQDGRAAIRYLKQNAGLYGIDSTKVFLVGSSAGAIQDLSVLYLDKASEIPEETKNEPALGALDEIGPAGPDALPDAVVSMWGASWNTSIIENQQIPLLLMHGENDNIVPFKKGIPLEGSVPDNSFVHFNMPETYGSYCIDTALTRRGIPHETYFVKEKGHEFYGVDTGMFPPDGPNEYWDTVHQKISEFLLEQFKPVAGFDFELNENTLTTVNSSSDDCLVSWDFGDGSMSSSWEPEHTYSQTGTYKLSLKVCNENLACDTISKTIKVDVISDANSYRSEEIEVYPNPVSDRLTISGFTLPFDLRLFDLTGGIQLQLEQVSGKQIDLSALRPGIYILELKSGQTSLVKKISKIN
ncbi:T9SS type A sorting domain-containing protein [Maribellus sediminis]|uniref:T9SS type A sorting domain-containing protein n=1 Tax=Maribellus sediminis TaxID=2696285 RepID=UPI00142FCA9A|nr:T9SS type A sorting domain-containing protein [Maribellus sediminis]